MTRMSVKKPAPKKPTKPAPKLAPQPKPPKLGKKQALGGGRRRGPA